MWCCNNKPCTGRGWKRKEEDGSDTWYGEQDKEGRNIGAECSGTPLKLTESCNETCNGDPEDIWRNNNGDITHLAVYPT